jgi:hypothetical protein
MLGKKAVIITLVMTIIAGGLLSGCTTVTGDKALSAAWCQETVNALRKIQPLTIPGPLASNGEKAGGEFNVNDYFPVLKHLSMEKGYVLDYVYVNDGSGGLPILFARAKDQVPFSIFDEYAAASGNVTRPENDMSLIWLVEEKENGVFGFGNKIKVQDSNEGYFEYTVLQIIGSQFYLFWHANLNDARIVCVADELEDILNDIDNDSKLAKIDDSFKASARALDLQPVVELSGDTVAVKLVVFSKWGGFSRYTFNISRSSPHSVMGYNKDTLLDYQCGLEF